MSKTRIVVIVGLLLAIAGTIGLLSVTESGFTDQKANTVHGSAGEVDIVAKSCTGSGVLPLYPGRYVYEDCEVTNNSTMPVSIMATATLTISGNAIPIEQASYIDVDYSFEWRSITTTIGSGADLGVYQPTESPGRINVSLGLRSDAENIWQDRHVVVTITFTATQVA